MKKIILAGVLTLLVSPVVLAHTVAIGTVNAGAPGSVIIWMGSYHTGSPTEGTISLDGGTAIGATSQVATASFGLPAGLILGDNVFYASGGQGNYNSPTTCCIGPTNWQGFLFTGLSAGLHNYAVAGMNSVVWSDWNTSMNNWTGTLNIPRGSVGVPEPGTLTLLGLGLLGLGLSRRRRQKSV